MSSALRLAQESRARRGEGLLDEQIEAVLDRIGLSEGRCLELAAENVGPHARKKLKGILAHYAKMAHPFRACKRDQMKNGLSEEMANRRCATLVDVIKGRKDWRGGSKKTNMSEASITPCSMVDDDVAVLLDAADQSALTELLTEAPDGSS